MLHREANEEDFAIAAAVDKELLSHGFWRPRPPLEGARTGWEDDDGFCSGGRTE